MLLVGLISVEKSDKLSKCVNFDVTQNGSIKLDEVCVVYSLM